MNKQVTIVAAVALVLISNYAWYHRIKDADSGVIKQQQQQELRQQRQQLTEEITKKEKMRMVAKKAIEEANKLIEINRELLAELKKLKAENNNNKVYI